ncbi:MAG: glycosyltransferase family 2 protein [Lachnospiraceae bacterium]|nr:glycosyltransferase family 2 protein [Lachnospiraceae bacterium]
MVIKILQGYFIFTIVLMVIYTIRHFIFTYNRLFCKQRVSYRDIYDSDLPRVTIMIPMHNEESVVKNVITSLLESDYDKDKFEIIPINDHSDDKTAEIVDEYHRKYPFIKPLHRLEEGERGKTVGLNDALKVATGEVIIVFDADYRPSKNLIKKLASAFKDPKVGAVMGRVIPINARRNLLTVLLNLERSGGYQIDQQARYNLKLLPQYGGTVGGFRKSIMLATGGFDSKVLAEDTELTYRLYSEGWTVVYDNSAECYEESPETWDVRGRQIRRWSRGHNEVLFKYFFRFLFSKNISFKGKIDGMLLLFIYAVPFVLGLAQIDCLLLFFLGEINIFTGWIVIILLGMYNTWGNFAPFFEIGIAAFIDGIEDEILALPQLCFSFFFYMWYISLGFIDAIIDRFTHRNVKWAKTVRFNKEETESEESKSN